MFEMPIMPQEPVKPKMFAFASAGIKEQYKQKKGKYDTLYASYIRLRELQETMKSIRSEIDVVRPKDAGVKERDDKGCYIITCPYCLEKFRVGEILFRANTQEDSAGNLSDCFDPEEDKAYKQFWERMGVNGIDSTRGHILNPNPDSGEIASITFVVDDVGNTETVPYNAQSYSRMQMQRVHSVVDRFGNQSAERVCPHCHTALDSQFGFSPNYIFTFIGNSSCGKTIYLNRLILTLTSHQFLKGNIFGFDASQERAGIEALVEFGDAKDAAQYIFTATGKSLAEATDIGYIPPVVLRMQDKSTLQKYFITLFDYPGEAIWRQNDAFFQPLADRIRTNADGIIMMFDVGVTLDDYLPEQYRALSGSRSDDINDPATFGAEKVINHIYHNTFGLNTITKPVAMVLSKSDLVDQCMQRLQGRVWTGEPACLRPSLPHNQVQLEEMYNCHCEVKQLLDVEEPGTTSTAEAMCNGNHAWFAVSSTGIPLENGTIPEGAVVSGIRETDPLEWLLYRNGHLTANLGANNEDTLRWAAAFQTGKYFELRKVEKSWLGDGIPGSENCEGEINIFNRLLNEYQALP